jgi:hypothetical protein
MLATVASYVPMALALTLLALANGKRPKPQGWVLIAVVAAVFGPVVVALVGFVAWIGLVAMATLALTVYACLRHQDRPPGGRIVGA